MRVQSNATQAGTTQAYRKDAKKKRPRISVDGLWTLILFKTNDLRYISVDEIPDKEWARERLKRIVDSISSDADFDRLLDLVDEVADGNALETLERLSMLF